jgi:hypothetical protein
MRYHRRCDEVWIPQSNGPDATAAVALCARRMRAGSEFSVRVY